VASGWRCENIETFQVCDVRLKSQRISVAKLLSGQKPMTIRFALVAITVFLTAGSVRAQECPNDIPEDSGVRRVQAKKWFSKGQTASNEGDDIDALKAYQCSLRYVPHGFTAYNIAQIAERIGDLEVAIASYSQYLLLVPDAKDGQEVNDKVIALKERLARAKQKEREITTAVPGGGTGTPPTEGETEQPKPPVVEEVKPVESVVAEKPSVTNYRMAAWIVYGGAGVALVGGLITNLMARSKMDTCNSLYKKDPEHISPAVAACDDAKPLAYMSYGLFGLGVAAAAVGTVLVLRPTESSEVSMNYLPKGGLSLGWGGKF
jgi:predicted RNA-binding protein with TRAM domain